MLREVICPKARNVHEKLTNSSKDVALLKFLINEKFRQRILCQIFRNGCDIPFYTFYFFFLFSISLTRNSCDVKGLKIKRDLPVS